MLTPSVAQSWIKSIVMEWFTKAFVIWMNRSDHGRDVRQLALPA